ncbi:MAG: hypothetical protein WEA09_02765 [Gemmatimonadota bacterium]
MALAALPLWMGCAPGDSDAPESQAPVFHPTFLTILEETPSTPHLAFGEVGGIVLQADGTLAILDRMAAEVRVVDMEGRLVRTVGRRGQGPGEFSGELTLGLLATPDDGLALPDLDRGVVVIFRPDGTPGDAVPWDVANHFIPEWRPLSTPGSAAARAVADSTEHLIRLELPGAGGLAGDTLATLPRIRQPPTAAEPRWPLLMDRWVWDVRENRAVAAQTSRAEILLYDDGQPTGSVSWDHVPAPVTDTQVEDLLRVVARTQGSPGEVPAELRARMLPPEQLHAVADLRLGPGGLILVQRLRPTSEMDRRILSAFGARGLGGRIWDLFSWEGERLGVLEFPSNVELFQILGDTLVGVLEGGLDVQRVFVATLPEGLPDS